MLELYIVKMKICRKSTGKKEKKKITIKYTLSVETQNLRWKRGHPLITTKTTTTNSWQRAFYFRVFSSHFHSLSPRLYRSSISSQPLIESPLWKFDWKLQRSNLGKSFGGKIRNRTKQKKNTPLIVLFITVYNHVDHVSIGAWTGIKSWWTKFGFIGSFI